MTPILWPSSPTPWSLVRGRQILDRTNALLPENFSQCLVDTPYKRDVSPLLCNRPTTVEEGATLALTPSDRFIEFRFCKLQLENLAQEATDRCAPVVRNRNDV